MIYLQNSVIHSSNRSSHRSRRCDYGINRNTGIIAEYSAANVNTKIAQLFARGVLITNRAAQEQIWEGLALEFTVGKIVVVTIRLLIVSYILWYSQRQHINLKITKWSFEITWAPCNSWIFRIRANICSTLRFYNCFIFLFFIRKETRPILDICLPALNCRKLSLFVNQHQ